MDKKKNIFRFKPSSIKAIVCALANNPFDRLTIANFGYRFV